MAAATPDIKNSVELEQIQQDLGLFILTNPNPIEPGLKSAIETFIKLLNDASTADERFQSFSVEHLVALLKHNKAPGVALLKALCTNEVEEADRINLIRKIVLTLQEEALNNSASIGSNAINALRLFFTQFPPFPKPQWLRKALFTASEDGEDPSPFVKMAKVLMKSFDQLSREPGVLPTHYFYWELPRHIPLSRNIRNMFQIAILNHYVNYLGSSLIKDNETIEYYLNLGDKLADVSDEYGVIHMAHRIDKFKKQADAAQRQGLAALAGRGESSYDAELERMTDRDFNEEIKPKFQRVFESYGPDQKTRMERIEQQIRAVFLDSIITTATNDKKGAEIRIAAIAKDTNPHNHANNQTKLTQARAELEKNQDVLQFIATHRAALIAGNLSEASWRKFSSIEVAGQCAWRCYKPGFTRSGMHNLIEGALEIRERVCYYFLTAIDDSTPEARRNVEERISDFVNYMATVRRGHNVLNSGADDAGEDETPCYRGHITRLGNIPRKHAGLRLSVDQKSLIERVARDYISKILRISLLQVRLDGEGFGTAEHRPFQQRGKITLNQVLALYTSGREPDVALQSSIKTLIDEMDRIQPAMDLATQQKTEKLYAALISLNCDNADKVISGEQEYSTELLTLRLEFQKKIKEATMLAVVGRVSNEGGFREWELTDPSTKPYKYMVNAFADYGGPHIVASLRNEFEPYNMALTWEEDEEEVTNPFDAIRTVTVGLSDIMKNLAKKREERTWNKYYFYELVQPIFKKLLPSVENKKLQTLVQDFVADFCSELTPVDLKQALQMAIGTMVKTASDGAENTKKNAAFLTAWAALSTSTKDSLINDLEKAYRKIPTYLTAEQEAEAIAANRFTPRKKARDPNDLPPYVIKKLSASGGAVKIDAAINTNGGTALMRAASEGHLVAMMVLLTAGANPEHTDYNRRSAFWYAQQVSPDAALNAKRQEVLQALRFMQNPLKSNPLTWAAIHNRVDILIEVLGYIAATTPDLDHRKKRINAPNPQGATALLWGAYEGSFESVMVLIEAGGNPGHRNSAGMDAYALARTRGHDALLTALEEMSNPLRSTPLIWSAIKNRTHVLAQLINLIAATTPDLEQRKRRINAPNPQNVTALLWAAHHNSFESVMLLIEAGGNPGHRNVAGADAYALASPTSHGALSTALNELRTNNSTPLVWSQAHQADRPALNPLLKQEGQDLGRSNPYKK